MGDGVLSLEGVGEGGVSTTESARLDRHAQVLRELGFLQCGSGWVTAGGRRVPAREVLWFLDGHLTVYPDKRLEDPDEELSDEAMYDIFEREIGSSGLPDDGLHVIEDQGRDEFREVVRGRAAKSVRPSTHAVYRRILTLWEATYDSTAYVLGLPSGDYYLKQTSDFELRCLVVCRFLIQLNEVEGKKKGELGRCLAAIRFYFACAGQPTAAFESEVVVRIRDSCGYSPAETRAVIERKSARAPKLPIPVGFLFDLYVSFRDIVNDPAAVLARSYKKKQGDSKILVGSAEFLQMSATCLFFMLASGIRPSNATKPEGKDATELRILVKDVMLVGKGSNGILGRVGLAYDSGKELVSVDLLEHAMVLLVDTKTGLNPCAKWVPVEPGTSHGKMLAVMLYGFACCANLRSEDKLFTRRSPNGGRCNPAVRNEDGTYSLPASEGTMCELRRRGPRALLWELAVRNGLPPESFSLKSCRITYATVGEIRHDVASGVLAQSAPMEEDDSDEDDPDVSDHGIVPGALFQGTVPSGAAQRDPLGNWSANSNTQTSTYSQARFLGSAAGSFLVDGRLSRKGVDVLLLPTLSLVPNVGATAGDSCAGGGSGSSQAGAMAQEPLSDPVAEDVEGGAGGAVHESDPCESSESVVEVLNPCCDQGPILPLAVCVGDTGHDLITVVGQYAGSPGDENFDAAFKCGLAAYQPYHGDVAMGGPPRRQGLDSVLLFHCGAHEDGEYCVPCDLARKSGCSRDDTGETRLVLAAECVGSEDNRGITAKTINGVPFSQVGFLHHMSCDCAAMPFCARVRADKCSTPTLCMAVAAKASICVLSYEYRSRFVPPGYQDWRLPHEPPLRHLEDVWTLEEQHRREVASAHDRAVVVLTRSEWITLRRTWLLARATDFRARVSAFTKTRKAAIETERVLQLNAEAEEVQKTGMLVFQQRVSGVGSQSAVSIAMMAVASSAARVMAYVKPIGIRAAVNEDQLRGQLAAEAIRVAESTKVLLATRERVRGLTTALDELNAPLEWDSTPPVTTSSMSVTEVEQLGPLVTGSALGSAATASSVDTGSGLFSSFTGVSVQPVPPTPAPVVSSDCSSDSTTASIAVTYCAVVPIGEPRETRLRRLSQPPRSFSDEQAANAHGGQQKRGPPGPGGGNTKKGRGDPDQGTRDHKKDEGGEGV